MAEYIKLEIENELGDVKISSEVLKHIALIEIEEDKDARLAGGLFKSMLSATTDNNKLIIEANIEVRFKAKVREVTKRLQERIDESLSHMTSYDVDEINLNVVGFIID